MPAQLAAFPKCYLDDLVVHHTMTLFEWIEKAATLPHVTGLELYPPALESTEPGYLQRLKAAMDEHHLQMPMMCASPDFIQRDTAQREAEIERQKTVIDVVAALGGGTCRVLSGQRLPDVSRAEGIQWTVEAIQALLPHAEARGVILVMENHYKDGYWQYPEFAQARDIYLEIISQIDSPWFGVNYDPSNALIAGDDPIELLQAVKHRMVTMHASDRSLEGGTIEDLRRMDADPMQGYASFVKHGIIGRGLIDYDRIFSILAEVNFAGWISIEDGQDPTVGMEHLRESAEFLWNKLTQYGLA
ncbi:MAG: TIM barrel protein [Abitibacteriaceae bacterium]|nr:TIM barrel protein [Abditibacteriaceae bacterium]MBV9867371.1 TIM barrel protein [Abditibacteriaceae bacterium]